MNRLVIIGNGFDLAHGLPTSYRSFLNWIWENFSKINKEDLFKNLFEINISHFKLKNYKDYSDFCNQIKFSYRSSDYNIYPSHYGESSFKISYKHAYMDDYPSVIFEFKNSFFELITVQNAENWVDIENTYYQVLLSIIKKDNIYPQINTIEKLNSEFLEIRKLLEYYLLEEIDNKYYFENTFSNCKDILDLFKVNRIVKGGDNDKLFLEFPASYRNEIERFNFQLTPSKIADNYHAYDNLFLDFNYTNNISFYVNLINKKNSTLMGRAEHIQIHGKLSDSDNPINFGFGDEMDDHYRILENTGDNKFLENIKSFMYFNNSNYRKLLNWIESNEYQIFIMGHSCGLSDRTLLNTLFEHNNCKSIKIFYHERNGKDNFTELSQNISRHFNKKSIMREKVVDKSLSKPLPQNVRYEIKP